MAVAPAPASSSPPARYYLLVIPDATPSISAAPRTSTPSSRRSGRYRRAAAAPLRCAPGQEGAGQGREGYAHQEAVPPSLARPRNRPPGCRPPPPSRPRPCPPRSRNWRTSNPALRNSPLESRPCLQIGPAPRTEAPPSRCWTLARGPGVPCSKPVWIRGRFTLPRAPPSPHPNLWAAEVAGVGAEKSTLTRSWRWGHSWSLSSAADPYSRMVLRKG